jgi:hypothetical protein
MDLQKKEDRKGLAGTILVHVLIFLFLLISGFSSQTNLDTENGGVMVSFGEPDAGGSGDEEPQAAAESSPSEQIESTPDEAVITNPDEVAPEVKTSEKPVPKKTEQPTTKAEPLEKKPTIDPRLKSRLEQLKRSKGTQPGKGSGDGTESGPEGKPDGADDGVPEGTGTGTLGNGMSYSLKGFSVSGRPAIRNEKQKFGTIVVEVCVNKQGQIISTKLGRKSTTTDSYLYSISERAVRELNITPVGKVSDTNCGSVTIEFKAN